MKFLVLLSTLVGAIAAQSATPSCTTVGGACSVTDSTGNTCTIVTSAANPTTVSCTTATTSSAPVVTFMTTNKLSSVASYALYWAGATCYKQSYVIGFPDGSFATGSALKNCASFFQYNAASTGTTLTSAAAWESFAGSISVSSPFGSFSVGNSKSTGAWTGTSGCGTSQISGNSAVGAICAVPTCVSVTNTCTSSASTSSTTGLKFMNVATSTGVVAADSNTADTTVTTGGGSSSNGVDAGVAAGIAGGVGVVALIAGVLIGRRSNKMNSPQFGVSRV